ncbi:MAG: LysR family transcriptional regulator, partial [Comamonadaceae bacterium]
MNITINQLRAFERIMRLGGFARAAQALHLTQPAISQRIRELETELGASLFERRGPRAHPTSDAHALLPYADRMLATLGDVRNRFDSQDPLRGTLRIGMSENVALVCLAEVFEHLERRYPGVQALVHVGDSGNLSRMLNSRELDLAIVA